MTLNDVSNSHEKAASNRGRLKEDMGRLKEAQKSYNKLKQDNETQLAQLAQRFTESAKILLGKDVKVGRLIFAVLIGTVIVISCFLPPTSLFLSYRRRVL